jgi:hypothetical protein
LKVGNVNILVLGEVVVLGSDQDTIYFKLMVALSIGSIILYCANMIFLCRIESSIRLLL